LANTQPGYPFRLFGDALMCNHFHLLSQPKPASQSAGYCSRDGGRCSAGIVEPLDAADE
jgi:hypothetical protein